MLVKALRLGLALVLMSAASATYADQYVEGTNYERLKTEIPSRDPERIEVVELFWYGCIHCFHLEPLLAKWKRNLADDVDFWRSPAIWNPRMAIHARAFYTAKVLGKLEELHTPLFTALNVEHKQLADADEIGEFFAKFGIEKSQFNKAFTSFGVSSMVRQADERARAYQIHGTPELIVAGKYRVTAKLAGGQSEMLDIVNFLIERERSERAAAAQET